MLHLWKAVRFRGASFPTNISATSKINSHPYTTLGSANCSKLIRARMPSITLARDSVFAAAFSTQSSGLRKAIWVDLTWAEMRESDSHAARLAFEKSNPFDDPNVHNCVVVFQYPPEDFPCTIVQTASAYGFGEGEAKIVQRESNKVVEAAGKTIEWPVIRKQEDSYPSSQHRIARMAPDLHIVFKLPSSKDPEVFVTELRKAGLQRGELMVLGGGPEETDVWWERLLYCMPENDKYW